MTAKEQALADDKMRAEISKLMAETEKLNRETEKINTKNWWYPLLLGSGSTLVILVITKLFL